jgi:hypothetical protein
VREYGRVSPQFWLGKTGKGLRGDMEAQMVALYLMTSPHANMIGVYHCPVLYIAHETGLPIEGATKGLQRLIEAGFCAFDEESDFVFVHKFAEYQVGPALKPGDLRVKGVENELSKLPNSVCAQAFRHEYGERYCLGRTDRPSSPRKGPSKPHRSQEQEQEQKKEQKKEKEIAPSADALDAPATPPPPPVALLPANDGSEYGVSAAQVAGWSAAYPGVDVPAELRRIREWLLANPARRKTSRGMAKFANSWLSRQQDRPRINGTPAKKNPDDMTFAEFIASDSRPYV